MEYVDSSNSERNWRHFGIKLDRRTNSYWKRKIICTKSVPPRRGLKMYPKWIKNENLTYRSSWGRAIRGFPLSWWILLLAWSILGSKSFLQSRMSSNVLRNTFIFIMIVITKSILVNDDGYLCSHEQDKPWNYQAKTKSDSKLNHKEY